MKKLLIAVVVALAPASAFADACAASLTGAFTAAQADAICAKFGGSIRSALVPQTDDAIALGSATRRWSQVHTEGITFGPALVPTMAATPVVGTNSFRPGLNIVPTAAANTAAFLGASATPVVGQHFIIHNPGPNAVRIKALAGLQMNGTGGTGAYLPLGARETVECFTSSATNQSCLLPAAPTPQGP